MTSSTPLRLTAIALATVLAGGLTLASVTTAAAAPLAPAAVSASVDVKDPSCVADDTRALCAEPEELLDVRIGDVHPTQPSLGYDEVYYKLGRYSSELSKDTINKKFDDWCEANGQEEAATAGPDATLTDPSTFTCTVPVGSETADTIEPMKTVVIGPGGTLYLTDGHHTLTSFFEDSGPDVHVRLRVLGNLSGLSEADFWDTMQAQKWVWLRDVDGNTITPAQLPTNVGLANFEDDRYRSIMYFGRDIGYSADGAVPFQEFYWGSWLRGHPELGVADWDQDDWAASLALVKTITQAQAALAPDTVIDPVSGYTAADLSAFTKWNDGKAETKGEWAKLSVPYSKAKPGKLAYMTAYRATLPAPQFAVTSPTPGQVLDTRTVVFRGTGIDGAVVTVTEADGTAVPGTAPVTVEDGAWTTTGTFPSYVGGEQSVTVTQTVGAEVTTAPVTFTLPEAVKLPAPTITSPTADAALVGSTATFAGTGTPGTNVVLGVVPTSSVEGRMSALAAPEPADPADPIVVDTDGRWSVTVALEPGDWTARAVLVRFDDQGGLPTVISEFSAPVRFTLAAAVTPAVPGDPGGAGAKPAATGSGALASTGLELAPYGIGLVLALVGAAALIARRSLRPGRD
ncbi:ParB-like protein [Cnuibacter sp. UC19_7]|uniref:ParB-like protein n=1 Tax=Cnuibacter sp. UC19_7 TaxID=3350166 RepID=UPI00366C1099